MPTIAWRVFDLATRSVQQVGQNGVPRSGLDSDFNNFAPRVGASWDLTGRGTLVMRGGYGLFYDSGTLIENSALYFNPPYLAAAAVLPERAGPDPIADSVSRPAPASHRADDQHHRPRTSAPATRSRRASAWSGRSPSTTLTARYVGAFGTATRASATSTSPRPARATSPTGGRSRGYGDILYIESEATSRYHALQVAPSGRSPATWPSRPATRGRRRGRHVVLPRHRRRRQHAAEQPRLRRPSGARPASTSGTGWSPRRRGPCRRSRARRRCCGTGR